MAKQKPITEKVIKEDEPKLIKEEVETVIGIAQAEKYQKSGWQLLDCHLTPEGKQYTFIKGKE